MIMPDITLVTASSVSGVIGILGLEEVMVSLIELSRKTSS